MARAFFLMALCVMCFVSSSRAAVGTCPTDWEESTARPGICYKLITGGPGETAVEAEATCAGEEVNGRSVRLPIPASQDALAELWALAENKEIWVGLERPDATIDDCTTAVWADGRNITTYTDFAELDPATCKDGTYDAGEGCFLVSADVVYDCNNWKSDSKPAGQACTRLDRNDGGDTAAYEFRLGDQGCEDKRITVCEMYDIVLPPSAKLCADMPGWEPSFERDVCYKLITGGPGETAVEAEATCAGEEVNGRSVRLPIPASQDALAELWALAENKEIWVGLERPDATIDDCTTAVWADGRNITTYTDFAELDPATCKDGTYDAGEGCFLVSADVVYDCNNWKSDSKPAGQACTRLDRNDGGDTAAYEFRLGDQGCEDKRITVCELYPTCGDGIVYGAEECDDGENGVETDACVAGCFNATCGDGHVWAGVEECDNGGDNDDSAACTSLCTLNVCGDGMVGPDEECDDGNTDNNDGCSGVCTTEKALCNLVRSCGNFANETCGPMAARQSTFRDYNDVPTSLTLDGSKSTCAETADAQLDGNAQWIRVALGSERLVGTVRFWSDAGAGSELEVLVTAEDASVPPASEAPLAQGANPSVGATLPALTEACAVSATATAGVFEASCGPATKGAFVFILRAAPKQALRVCDVEAFQHACLPDDAAELSCGLGYEPSTCDHCKGCVPCSAGFYSDKVGPYQCTACPGSPQPYSPAGSTSEFQCEGDAFIDGTSSLAVADEGIAFNQTIDSWEIVLEYTLGWKVEVNGLAGLFLSKGGTASPTNDAIFSAKNFPCRADGSEAANSDLSVSLEETVCCLQDLRQDYFMTDILRRFTDTLDLVAANDECDSESGSNELVNADIAVVAAEGTTSFVDSSGAVFANDIRVEPVSNDGEKFKIKVTIPDAELFKISKSLNPDQNLTDTRELFIGLLDMVPTGTRVVDSSSQQIKIVLTRTQYGTFAAYGEQNIEYDFISFLNGRAHKVFDQSPASFRRAQYGDAYYAEITFVYDDRLFPNGSYPVDIASVTVDGGDACDEFPETNLDDFTNVVETECGPKDLMWENTVCPQVSLSDDKLGRLYIPLASGSPLSGTVDIAFKLLLKDAEGLSADLSVALTLVVDDYVSWCDEDEDSVDLTKDVEPSMIIGTESANPPRLSPQDFGDVVFTTDAETLQDGLITMVLEITDEEKNLEIFFEDVLVVQVNPGSNPSADELADEGNFIPTYKYDPDSRDAELILPEALNASCPEATFSESFFSCVHKHVLKEEAITNKEWAYLVGSDPVPGSGAQDFMQAMLGTGTAAVAARQLGRDYEQYLTGTVENVGTKRKIGLWINPGHVWGQTVHNSEYSLSEHMIVYVLYGVKSGVDGTVTRRLLQATPNGNTMVTKTLKYDVTAASVVERALPNVAAVSVEAKLALSADEACWSQQQLLDLCAPRLEAAVTPFASSQVQHVACISLTVLNAQCDGTRRAASDPAMLAQAVIALDNSNSPAPSIDFPALLAAGALLDIKSADSSSFPAAQGQPPASEANADASDSDKSDGGSGASTLLIGAAAGAAVAVVLVALGVWKVSKKCNAPPHEPLCEVVSTGVVTTATSEKDRIETLLFEHQPL